MLKSGCIHPGIMSALSLCGHGDKILIADGNYPLNAKSGDAAKVYLGLAEGIPTVTEHFWIASMLKKPRSCFPMAKNLKFSVNSALFSTAWSWTVSTALVFMMHVASPVSAWRSLPAKSVPLPIF